LINFFETFWVYQLSFLNCQFIVNLTYFSISLNSPTTLIHSDLLLRQRFRSFLFFLFLKTLKKQQIEASNVVCSIHSITITLSVFYWIRFKWFIAFRFICNFWFDLEHIWCNCLEILQSFRLTWIQLSKFFRLKTFPSFCVLNKFEGIQDPPDFILEWSFMLHLKVLLPFFRPWKVFPRFSGLFVWIYAIFCGSYFFFTFHASFIFAKENFQWCYSVSHAIFNPPHLIMFPIPSTFQKAHKIYGECWKRVWLNGYW
jgi:hypothetical protein